MPTSSSTGSRPIGPPRIDLELPVVAFGLGLGRGLEVSAWLVRSVFLVLRVLLAVGGDRVMGVA